jgi:hypothetical protein
MEDFYQQLTGTSREDAIAKRLEIEKKKRKEEQEKKKQEEREFCEKQWPQIKQEILKSSKNNFHSVEYEITRDYYRPLVTFLKDKGFGVEFKRLHNEIRQSFLITIEWD